MRRLTALALAGSLLAPAAVREPSASQLYKTGRKYEKRKDYANAYLYYSKAAAADPAKKEYWLRAQALQRKAIESAHALPASVTSLNADAETDADAASPLPPPDDQDLREIRRPQPPVELQAGPELRDFDIKGDYKQLWEQVTEAYGLGVVFDGDYEAAQPRDFHITGADYRTALNALMAATGSFFSPISEKLLMVVKDTEQKRREVETHIAVAIPLPEPFQVQEAQELGRVVQQVMEIQRLSIDSAHRVVILRDRMSKVRPAEILYRQLLYSRAQVSMEVEFLSVVRTTDRTLGTTLPTSTSLTPLVKTIALSGASPFTYGITLAGATLLAKQSVGASRTLYASEVRSLDGAPASLQVGQKYPIQTVGYIGSVPSGQTAYTPPPSFNFEDLGFNIKLKPKVHDAKELTIEVDTEFKLLGGSSLNGIPVISHRKFATTVRLGFDQAAVISGLVSASDFRTLAGPAGLLNVPVLGTLLGTETLNKANAEIILVIRPKLLTNPPTEFTTRQIWLGAESRPRIPM